VGYTNRQERGRGRSGQADGQATRVLGALPGPAQKEYRALHGRSALGRRTRLAAGLALAAPAAYRRLALAPAPPAAARFVCCEVDHICGSGRRRRLAARVSSC